MWIHGTEDAGLNSTSQPFSRLASRERPTVFGFHYLDRAMKDGHFNLDAQDFEADVSLVERQHLFLA